LFLFQKIDITEIISLFDFSKKHAVGEFDLNNLILGPLNIYFLRLLIGILFFLQDLT